MQWNYSNKSFHFLSKVKVTFHALLVGKFALIDSMTGHKSKCSYQRADAGRHNRGNG